MTPEQIHELGLAEVDRIRGEMDKVMAQTGFKGNFKKFSSFLRKDPRFFYKNKDDLLTGYRDIAKRIDPELIRFFGKLPRLPYGVLPVPAYSEKSQTTAYYQSGSLKAGRPGYFYANTYALNTRPKWEMEALTSHEAVPGHHLQISLGAGNGERAGVPQARRLHGVRRRLGPLRRRPERGDGSLQGSLLEIRPAHLRNVARDPARGRHRHAFAGLDAGAVDRVISWRTPARPSTTSRWRSIATSSCPARRWLTSSAN